jgi:outer membrane protein assembly factor BamB
MFAPNSDGNVYVLDLDDGQSEKDAIKVIRLSASSGQTDRLWAQPLTDGTRIFVTSLDHRIFAISLETYEVLWEKQLDAAIPGAPALGADGMLYVGSLAKKLERIDPATGKNESVLGQEIKDWVWGTPIAEGDNLYFGDVSGNFYSYNVITGKLNWDLKLDGAITASPLIFRDQILVATESGVIYAVTADGNTEIWHQPAEEKSKAYTTPVQAGDYVLVAYLESDYYLVALDQDGDVKWTFTGK